MTNTYLGVHVKQHSDDYQLETETIPQVVIHSAKALNDHHLSR